jgi:hypothetical protein
MLVHKCLACGKEREDASLYPEKRYVTHGLCPVEDGDVIYAFPGEDGDLSRCAYAMFAWLEEDSPIPLREYARLPF